MTKAIVRRLIVCGWCALLGAWAAPAFAASADDAASAPLAKDELHHHVILQNEFVRIFRVLIPPGQSTGWHEHNFDYIVLAVNGSKVEVRVAGKPDATAAIMETKSLTYTDYAGKRFVHRVANTDVSVNQQLAFEILPPAPLGFTAGDRSRAPQYKLEIDNNRIRAWRLQLPPGEIAGVIAQKAPAVRFVIAGDRLVETDSAGLAREQHIRSGEFKWMPSPATRSLANGGTTPLELIEIELK